MTRRSGCTPRHYAEAGPRVRLGNELGVSLRPSIGLPFARSNIPLGGVSRKASAFHEALRGSGRKRQFVCDHLSKSAVLQLYQSSSGCRRTTRVLFLIMNRPEP